MINTNLKRLRKIHQYTQEELAEKLNISRQSVAKG
ncbi:helix-turn-helix transcriptional regulator, partial [Clostridioides difficile]